MRQPLPLVFGCHISPGLKVAVTSSVEWLDESGAGGTVSYLSYNQLFNFRITMYRFAD